MELAERIGGVTADELGERMTHRELVEWQVLDEVRAAERAKAEEKAKNERGGS